MLNMFFCNYFVSALGLLLGVLIMLASAQFPLEFSENGPGPGFWPFSLGAVLFLAAVILLLATFFDKERLIEESVSLILPQNRRVYLMMAFAVLYCVLLNLLGFYCTSFLAIPVIMYMLNYKQKRVILITAFLTMLAIYLLFGQLLHTKMPQPFFLS